ncbi:MAG: carbon monoxide dehydrogenase subunit [Pseudonocardia sp.]|jgi:carbon monoxide dehydrogenase subunit G|nr:carbon monoxide dehydrogenase subunit [Pseudonocardia sp.]
MLIENEFEVAAPLDKVWDHFLDVPKIAPCMPGAELTEVAGDGVYKGRLLTKMGPVSLTFTGTAQIIEQDPAAKRIVMKASGSESKGKGQAEMTVTSTLERSGSGTKVKVSQDIQIAGALAQFGRGMISDVTTVLMRSFASCIQDNIDRESRGEAAGQRAAAPVSGVSVGFSAFVLAIKRFFGRFFGRSSA